MLSESKLATVLSEAHLSELAKFGEVIDLAPDELLFRVHQPSNYLYITIAGDIFLISENGDDALPVWVGPGDILGEIGFFLGAGRTKTARAGTSGCVLWRISRSRLYEISDEKTAALLTHLLIALAPYVKVRRRKLATPKTVDSELGHNHCDHTHPAIIQLARSLRRGEAWATAVAIWEFVRSMPYRFGFWDLKASATLQLGYGMCTTKANLQVALLRACGLAGAFTELKIDSQCVSLCMPKAYRATIGRQIKHYFAVVKLDGRWFPCDASFTPQCMPLVINTIPEFAPYQRYAFGPDRPYNIVGEASGLDPFDFQPLPDLAKVMSKKPFYDEDNFEAMNVLLDKAQGAVHQLPVWAEPAKALLPRNPAAAFQKAFAGITVEVRKLFSIICRNEGWRVPDEKKKVVIVTDDELIEVLERRYEHVIEA
ncbi:cyclic nucleotide-binding domain-containing protein [candidate division KSB1 bacterium]|nr:cyclic nucleotide-binding domain-containing protein [candidate division KSB1 bacterium]